MSTLCLLDLTDIDADALAIVEAVRRTSPPGRAQLRAVIVAAPDAESAARLQTRVARSLAEGGWGEVEVEAEVGEPVCRLVAVEVASRA